MNLTKIDWATYTWNPVTGCTRGCPYCYARRIAHRFRRSFEPTFHRDRLFEPSRVKKPSVIFAVSMGDLFDGHVHEEWIDEVLGEIRRAHWHRFVILTKCWLNMAMYCYGIPTNTIAMATVTTNGEAGRAINDIGQGDFSQCKVGLCVEPIREPIDADACHWADWVILGCETGPGAPAPNRDAVARTVAACKTADVPVFVKRNTGLDGPQEIPRMGGDAWKKVAGR